LAGVFNVSGAMNWGQGRPICASPADSVRQQGCAARGRVGGGVLTAIAGMVKSQMAKG